MYMIEVYAERSRGIIDGTGDLRSNVRNAAARSVDPSTSIGMNQEKRKCRDTRCRGISIGGTLEDRFDAKGQQRHPIGSQNLIGGSVPASIAEGILASTSTAMGVDFKSRAQGQVTDSRQQTAGGGVRFRLLC